MSQASQIKGTLATLGASPKTPSEKRAAQLVVCEYVEAWHAEDSEDEKAVVARELLDILGLLERR